MAIEEENRELNTGELYDQLEDMRKQLSSISSKIETIEGALNEHASAKLNPILKLRKQTLKKVMLEYRRVKGEMIPIKSEELNENEDR